MNKISPHVMESKKVSWILDSTPGIQIPSTGFQSSSVELGFSGIPDSFSCIRDFKAEESGFQNQNVSAFRILDFTRTILPYSGIRIPLHGVNRRSEIKEMKYSGPSPQGDSQRPLLGVAHFTGGLKKHFGLSRGRE